MIRIYDIRCAYENEEFSELKLTAEFTVDAIERTLSIIALTLNIDYEKKGKQVLWTSSES